MRIGWISAPITACSGYGKVTKEICLRLADNGHDVVNIGGRGTSVVLGEKFSVLTPKGNKVLLLPAWGQTGDRGTIEYYIQKYDLDVLVSLFDAYVLNFGKPSKPWAAYFPIDTHLTKIWLSHLTNPDYLVSYSKFGYEELLKHFPDFMVRYIKHGCDTQVFRPRSEEEKLEIRQKWNIPEDVFLMLNISANWGERKSLPQLMITFKRFLKNHPDAMLYLHTNLKENCPQGYDLMTFAEELGIADKVLGPKFNVILDSIEDEKLAELYAAADVYVSAAMGEGFGLPLLESMASGVPCIAPKNSSQVELVEGHGWLVENVPKNAWEDVPVWLPYLARYPVPDLNSLLRCMEDAYNDPDERESYGKASREFALNYSWDKFVIPKWEKLIEEMVEGG